MYRLSIELTDLFMAVHRFGTLEFTPLLFMYLSQQLASLFKHLVQYQVIKLMLTTFLRPNVL